MTRDEVRKHLKTALPHVFGIGGILLIVLGVWGLAGWSWAAITAGALPAGFYVYGEVRALRIPKSPPLDQEI